MKVTEIKPYQLKNTLIKLDHAWKTNNLKKFDTCKIQLTIAVNFISSKGTDKELVMHSKSENKEIMIYDKADEVIKELLNHLFLDIKLGWKHQWKVVILSLVVFIYCITTAIK